MKTVSVKLKINAKEIEFWYRPDSVGDKGVIKQVFQQRDYELVHWQQRHALYAFRDAQILNGRRPLIVDAGANIGAAATYFSCTFQRARILAIEPEKNNCALLRANVAGLNVEVFEAAIGAEDCTLFLSNPEATDWAFRVGKSGEMPVPVMSPRTLLASPAAAGYFPFIFKIDIEGGEDYLFSGDDNWVDKFPLLIIELHDWMLPFAGSSRGFLRAIASLDFDVVHRGENIFCFNRRLLLSYAHGISTE